LARRGPYLLETIDALLWLGSVQVAAGLAERGDDHLREARRLLDRCADPGMLFARARKLSGPGDPEALSRRETEVLGLLQSPLSESEIGSRLFISRNTVHSHTKSIFRKLGVSSRAEAVERARAAGLLDGDGSGEVTAAVS
jgi:LuxR family maltose regulon positive regulatory protein